MKRGQVLYRFRWHANIEQRYVNYRFRIGPVPGIHNSSRFYFYCWHKRPRVMNESRQWFASEGYGRKKRSPLNLPDPWDDYQRGDIHTRKSWKSNKKVTRQYMKNI